MVETGSVERVEKLDSTPHDVPGRVTVRIFLRHPLTEETDILLVELAAPVVLYRLLDAIMVAWGAHPASKQMAFQYAFDLQHRVVVDRKMLCLYALDDRRQAAALVDMPALEGVRA